MDISYARFKAIFGDLGITEWVKYNWLSNAGTARAISNEVIEAGYNPLAYINDELYNHITKSINIWDEEIIKGLLINGVVDTTYNCLSSKNLIEVSPNTSYYFTRKSLSVPGYGYILSQYDRNGNFIKQTTIYSNTFTTENNTKYIMFSNETTYGTTYNHDICINESNPYLNGNYFPYFEGEKFLVLVGEVDLGTLNYSSASNYRFMAEVNNIKPSPNNDTISNLLCSYNYVNSTGNSYIRYEQSMYVGVDGKLVFRNTSYTNVAAFKAAMSGVMFYYQLASPVLVDL